MADVASLPRMRLMLKVLVDMKLDLASLDMGSFVVHTELLVPAVSRCCNVIIKTLKGYGGKSILRSMVSQLVASNIT
jgi:hypothetical protein